MELINEPINKRKSITLVEALVTIALIALLTILLLTRIGGTLDRPKDLEVTRDLQKYADAAQTLLPTGKDFTEENLSKDLPIELKLVGTESNKENPYGQKYKYTTDTAGKKDFTITSTKVKNGVEVYKCKITVTNNNGVLTITPSESPGSSLPITEELGGSIGDTDSEFFYTYTDIGDGYKLGLSPDFKIALNANTSFRSWNAGDPLPNPGSIYNNLQVKSMEAIFKNSQASTLDLSKFDTSNVTAMSEMFSGSHATTLDLSSFDTSKVTNMSEMFYWSPATTLDLSSFDTSKVYNMYRMFFSSNASTLDLSNFDTSKVTNMSGMFHNSKAITLDISSLNTSNVTNMANMFYSSQATTLNLSSFDTSNVTTMYAMFTWSQATTLDLSKFDISKVKDMSGMFRESKATTGYARTAGDANKLNASSNKPARLVFVVK